MPDNADHSPAGARLEGEPDDSVDTGPDTGPDSGPDSGLDGTPVADDTPPPPPPAPLLELRDGKIWRETTYWAEPFDAPAWRRQWVEPLD